MLLPRAQTVSPAPDGGYPEGNTAEGQSALFSRTTGGLNTAVGFLSLRSDTTGNFNRAVGGSALLSSTGFGNTALGGLCLQPLTHRKPVLTPYDEQVGENDALTLG